MRTILVDLHIIGPTSRDHTLATESILIGNLKAETPSHAAGEAYIVV